MMQRATWLLDTLKHVISKLYILCDVSNPSPTNEGTVRLHGIFRRSAKKQLCVNCILICFKHDWRCLPSTRMHIWCVWEVSKNVSKTQSKLWLKNAAERKRFVSSHSSQMTGTPRQTLYCAASCGRVELALCDTIENSKILREILILSQKRLSSYRWCRGLHAWLTLWYML